MARLKQHQQKDKYEISELTESGHLSEVLNAVASNHEKVTITDHTKPIAVVVSFEHYLQLLGEAQSDWEAAKHDQAHFEVSDEQWETFNALLKRPAQDKPSLRRLLTTPSVFENDASEWITPLS